METAEYPDGPGPGSLWSSGEQETLSQIRQKATVIPKGGLLSSSICQGKEVVLKQEKAKTYIDSITHTETQILKKIRNMSRINYVTFL